SLVRGRRPCRPLFPYTTLFRSEGGARGGDGAVDVLRIARGDVGELPAGGRVDALEGRAGDGGHEAAVEVGEGADGVGERGGHGWSSRRGWWSGVSARAPTVRGRARGRRAAARAASWRVLSSLPRQSMAAPQIRPWHIPIPARVTPLRERGSLA